MRAAQRRDTPSGAADQTASADVEPVADDSAAAPSLWCQNGEAKQIYRYTGSMFEG